MVAEQWLIKVNERLSKEGVAHRQRPLEALRILSIENNISVAFDSPDAKAIFSWFSQNTKPGSQNIGALYISTYYFDNEFWQLEIPVFYGSVEFSPFDALRDMPILTKERLIASNPTAEFYARHWANCFDYGLGMDVIRKTNGLNPNGMEFLAAAEEELTSASNLLNKARINPRALLDSRMAIEMFFKAYAGLHGQLSEREARGIGHSLDDGLDKYIGVSGNNAAEGFRPLLDVFPPVRERYRPVEKSKEQIWHGFSCAQAVGAMVVREFGGYDVSSELEKKISTNE